MLLLLKHRFGHSQTLDMWPGGTRGTQDGVLVTLDTFLAVTALKFDKRLLFHPFRTRVFGYISTRKIRCIKVHGKLGSTLVAVSYPGRKFESVDEV